MIYLISGLGADERIFGRLKLLKENPHQFIHWIPTKENTLKEYTLRLAAQIDQQKEVILIGVSFGGIIAVEMSKIVNCRKVILISSIATKKEIPILYKTFGALQLHKLLPSKLLKWANPATYFLFGVQEKEDKTLLENILKDTDAQFLKWAINQILQWQNVVIPSNIVRIHGTKDWILPFPKTQNVWKVQNGGHLMVWTHSKEVNEAILSVIL